MSTTRTCPICGYSRSYRSTALAKVMQRMLGHASAAMTLDVYAGLFEGDMDDVADRMDEAARKAAEQAQRESAGVVELPRYPEAGSGAP